MDKYKLVVNLLLPAIVIFFTISSCNNLVRSDKVSKDQAHAKKSTFFSLQSKIPLPEVTGGFDLMSLDIIKQRLFVSAEDNHSIEVLDLKGANIVKSIGKLDEPKWSFYFPERNKLFVATGGDGKVSELDATTFKIIKEFHFKEACNNLRFDEVNQQLIVGVGQSFGALGIIDLKQDKIVKEIPLSGYLKQFELDGSLVYVNIPGKNQVDVVDRGTNKVRDIWPLKGATQNVPMALDKINHRLFIGCEPGQFVVLSTKTGLPVSKINISKGADGIYFDKKRSLIYVSCGEGYINIVKQNSANQYQLIEKIKTRKGAATSLYSPLLDKLFLAVPQSGNEQAAIWIYQPTT